MPDTTPIYGFPYPCPDEVVNAASFTALANAIDTKLLDLQADETAALNRPNARRVSAANTATAGVVNVTIGANSNFVIPAAGVWLVSAFIGALTGAGASNMYRLRVRNNAVVQFGTTKNGFFGITTRHLMCQGTIVCAVGDTIDTDFFYVGTLTVGYSAILELKMITRIA